MQTEGPETALSVWLATGYETFIRLGGIGKHQLPLDRTVVVCRDDDPPRSAADKGLSRALADWNQSGADLRMATPWAERRGDRSDFNDVLQADGEEAVRARIETALNPMPTAFRPVRMPVTEARVALSNAVEGFFFAAMDHDGTLNAAWEAARAEIAPGEWGRAPNDVRAFLVKRDAARVSREEVRETRRIATEAWGAVKLARQAEKHARMAYDKARAAVSKTPEADQAAACAERDRLKDTWHRACDVLDMANQHAAETRAARQAAMDASADRKDADDESRDEDEGGVQTRRLKNEVAKIRRRIKSLAMASANVAAGAPPVHAIRVDVGGGKSTEARRQTAIQLAKMRADGDVRTAIFFVPTIKLADEQAALFRSLPEAAGLKVAVWRGRKQPDPDRPEGDAMCLDLDAVADAQEAMADIQTGVCEQREKDGTIKAQCRFFEECGYQKQRRRRADIFFAAHEMLFESKPVAMGEPAFLVIDESAWQDGLIGIGSGQRSLSLETLAREVTVPDDPLGTERLCFLGRRMFDALSRLPDGPIPRAVIVATGITSQSAAEARALEWRRKRDAKIFPGTRPEARKKAVQAVVVNKTIARLSLFWSAIENLMRPDGPVASGWAELTVTETKEGLVRTIDLKGRKDIDRAFRVPALILDATMRPEPPRWFWPNLEVTADIAIQTPHQRVVQVQDRSYSKNHLRQPGNFQDVRAILFRLAREYAPGRVLGVIQQEFEEKLREQGALPVNLELAHHNAVAGQDGWSGVAALVVIGRTAPSPHSMEQLAEALSGEAIPRSTKWYSQVDGVREMADGSYRAAQSDQHSHALVEACRWSAAESETVQITGRGRACNRTEADPVHIWVLGNMPLPLPVDRLISASDLTPSPGDLMAASGGVELANPTDAAAAYPDLWSTRAGAKSAMSRSAISRLGAFSYENILIRECTQPPPDERPGMIRIDYQLAGPGKKQAMAWADLALVPDPAAWLANRVGELAWVRITEAARVTPDVVEAPVKVAHPPAANHVVIEAAGGSGDLLERFPNMTVSSIGAVIDILTISSTAETVIILGGRITIRAPRCKPAPSPTAPPNGLTEPRRVCRRLRLLRK